MNKLKVSFSPHAYGKLSINKLMYGVIIALFPALAISIYFYGLGAIVVTLTSVISCLAFEFLITKYMLNRKPELMDGSAIITGLLLAFNVPSNLPVWIILLGSLVAIGIAKMSFGGLGNNIFNPALVGRVFLLISFPVQMTRWPVPKKTALVNWFFGEIDMDANTGATVLGALKQEIDKGERTVAEILEHGIESVDGELYNFPDYLQQLIGNIGGSLGEISAIALIIGLGYLLIKKIITWHIPVSILGTVFVFTGILHLLNPDIYVAPLFHLLTGGLLLGAIFMATDYVTSPMTKKGMLIYGVGIGIITVVIRVWGSFPEGISYAILIMNACVPIINMYAKPKRFGEAKV
jgi:electron transport complex protein RnfD